MSLQKKPGRRGLLTAAGIMLLAAVYTPPGHAATATMPQYPVVPCCQLCPRAADPALYAGSSYLHDFRVLIQARNDWLFRTELDLATQFVISDDSISELRRFADALRRRGTELMIVYQPPRGLMDAENLSPEQRKHYDFAAARRSYAAALARIRLAGVIVPPLDQLADKSSAYEYFFRRDHHWTPSGAEHTARLIADTLKTMPIDAKLSKKSFATHWAGIIGKPGTLQKVASGFCGGTYSMQYVPATTTDPVGGGGSLLGDESHPQVVLVGTSNSDTKGGYNFNGYLEQYIGSDVLDVAITGGSFDGSLLTYLPSEEYQKHPPKLIIWETPYQDYPSTTKDPFKTFRQAVPLISNGCQGKPSFLSKTMALHQGSNEVLANVGGHLLDITGNNAEFDIRFDDPAIKEMHAVIYYFNGQKEELKLRFKDRVDNKGRFVAELRHDTPELASAGFLGLTLEIDKPLPKPLTVNAVICARDPHDREFFRSTAADPVTQ